MSPSERLALFSTALPNRDLSEVLDYCVQHHIPQLELGVGGYPGTRHADAHLLCARQEKRTELQSLAEERGIRIAALSCHGNPLHPDPQLAQRFDADFHAALELANALEIEVVVGFSGQPGPGTPNWPVLAWPYEYADLWERQWQDQLLPYWQRVAERASNLGVKIALEMHGGFAVHSPSTLFRLREACGPAIGANLDPSHLWWQGIDPNAAAQLLGEAVYHFHVKDLSYNSAAMVRHGVLDHTPHHLPHERAWFFSLPGQGHNRDSWQQLLATIEGNGYRGVFSIEHEAPLPAEQGIAAAAAFIHELG